MPYELTDTQLNELLPAFVLGALEAEEMLEMDEYIQRQRTMLKQLDELERAVVHLVHSAPLVPLPAANKERLMARVRAGQTAEMRSMAARPAAPHRSVQRPQVATPSLVDQVGQWFSGLSMWRVAAATALGLLLVSSFYSTQLRTELTQTTAALQVAEGELQRTENEIAELEQVRQSLEQQLRANESRLAIFANAQRTVALPGTEEAPGARATFYQSGQEGLLVLQGLEPLAAGQTYELWLIPADGDPVPAGLFNVTSTGPQSQHLAMPAGANEYAAVGVSVEPSGGSAQPTGPIVLLGTVVSGAPDS